MKNIILISCVSKKKDFKTKARNLYDSPLFKGALAYAEKLKPDNIYILSALYGVVGLEDSIEPYNKTLNNMGVKDKRAWVKQVLNQLEGKGVDLEQDRVTFLAGNEYRKYLIDSIKNYQVPMEGLPIGKQLQFLKEKLSNE